MAKAAVGVDQEGRRRVARDLSPRMRGRPVAFVAACDTANRTSPDFAQNARFRAAASVSKSIGFTR